MMRAKLPGRHLTRSSRSNLLSITAPAACDHSDDDGGLSLAPIRRFHQSLPRAAPTACASAASEDLNATTESAGKRMLGRSSIT